MSSPKRRLLFVAFARCLALLSGLWLAGCLSSPTLPLPPPSPDDPTVPVNGVTQLEGSVPSAQIGVRVLALNLNTNLVFGEETSTHHFSFSAAAQSGDVFAIWYTVGDESSEPVNVTVPFPTEPDAGEACDAATCNGDAGGTTP